MTRRTDSALMLAGLLLVAVNLTPSVVSVGVTLTRVQQQLHLPDGQLVLLTGLPLAAAGVFGALAKTAAQVFGLHRITLLSLIAIAVGTFSRALSSQSGVFLFLSAVAYAGAATVATLLPALVRRHFPGRAAGVGALCATTTGLATVLVAALTRPITHAGGGWRTGLAVWGVPALLAAVPWLRLVLHDRTHRRQGLDVRAVAMLRAPLAQALSLLLALQALQAAVVVVWLPTLWNRSGFTAAQAGLLVALAAAVAVPLALLVPAAAMWDRDPRRIVAWPIVAFALAFLGLLWHPHILAVPCAILAGVGTLGPVLVLVLIGLRARTPHGATALTHAVHAAGYVLAAAALVGVGFLRTGVHSWHWPLALLAVLALPEAALLWYAGRPGFVEDQLAARSRAHT